MKRVLLILTLFCLLAVSIGAGLLRRFDVNRYKGELVALIAKQTGRSFGITGDIRFAPSLVPTVVVEGIRFGNAAWSRHGDLAVIDRVEAQAALLPLLRGHLEIKRLELSGAKLWLETNEKGEGNWVIGDQKPTAANTAAPLPFALAVRQIRVEKSTLQYHEAKAAAGQSLDIKSLRLESTSAGAPITLDFDGAYRGLPLSLSGTVGSWEALRENQRWPFDLKGRLKAVKAALRGEAERPVSGEGIRAEISLNAETLAALGDLAGRKLPPLSPVSVSASIIPLQKKTGQGYSIPSLTVKVGNSDLAGHLQVDPTGPRPIVGGEFNSNLIDLAEILPSPEKEKKSERMFSTNPLPFPSLRVADAKGVLRVGVLKTHKMVFDKVAVTLALTNGRLTLDPFDAGLAGGRVDGTLSADATAAKPKINIELHGKGILPGQLPQLAGKHLENAPTDFTFDLHGNGASAAEIMGDGNGKLLVHAGAGRMPNNLASTDLLLDSLRLLNPLAKSDPYTNIECAVVNFGIKNGVASGPTGLGVRTDKLSILGGGTVDLKTERIDIGAKPKPRTGVGLNIAALGDFVRLGGTLSNPHPATDAGGAAEAGLKVGAAVATGGLTLLAEGLFDRASSDDDVCAIAAGTQPLRSAQKQKSVMEKTTDTTKEAAKSATDAVQGVFKSIFGK
ncbi:MAG TPA: AsmA family protein [Gammaproteobacteria bacterium]|nr:AsmA family protein [Gammaproteobacteria bacterium]